MRGRPENKVTNGNDMISSISASLILTDPATTPNSPTLENDIPPSPGANMLSGGGAIFDLDVLGILQAAHKTSIASTPASDSPVQEGY